MRLGHSYAVTIPTAWCNATMGPHPKYLELDLSNPDEIVLRPLKIEKLKPHDP